LIKNSSGDNIASSNIDRGDCSGKSLDKDKAKELWEEEDNLTRVRALDLLPMAPSQALGEGYLVPDLYMAIGEGQLDLRLLD